MAVVVQEWRNVRTGTEESGMTSLMKVGCAQLPLGTAWGPGAKCWLLLPLLLGRGNHVLRLQGS